MFVSLKIKTIQNGKSFFNLHCHIFVLHHRINLLLQLNKTGLSENGPYKKGRKSGSLAQIKTYCILQIKNFIQLSRFDFVLKAKIFIS
jgi:hypothetical protein